MSRSHNQPKSRGQPGSEPSEHAPIQNAAPEINSVWRSLALRPVGIQPKLTVGQANDPSEQEADRVAADVMRMPTPTSSDSNLSFSSHSSSKAQRKCSPCDEEEKLQLKERESVADQVTAMATPDSGSLKLASISEHHPKAVPHVSQPDEEEEKKLQRQEHPAGAQASVIPSTNLALLKEPGQPLDSATRSFFEPRFGKDFSRVRVHANADAARSALALNAHAYTLGSDVVFGSGQYAPGTIAGNELLAHELTHVVQQSAGAPARPAVIQRRQRFRTPPTLPATLSPEESFRRAAGQLDTLALPQFQAAVDNVNEAAVREAGLSVLAVWHNIEGGRQAINAAPIPPASPPAAPATASPAPTPQTGSAPPVAATGLSAELQAVYDEARRKVLVGVSTQKFQNRFVLERERVPPYEGDLAMFILQQTDEVAAVVRDTTELVGLLQRDNLPEPEQWRAIGLLRQHLNPWNFAYMRLVVTARGLPIRFARFAIGPLSAYAQLVTSQGQILAIPEVDPSSGLGDLALIPRESKVRLVQPLSPMEVAEMLYGDAERWQTHLLPYNLRALSGVGARSWLPVGTELIVDADLLVPRFRPLFLSAARVRHIGCAGNDPYLWAQPEATAVVGNTVRYGVAWPNSAFDHIDLEWWVENDLIAVRENGAPARVQGPRGRLSWAGRSEHTTLEARASVPGNHVIVCRVTRPDGRAEELRHTQTVMTLEQKTTLEARREVDWSRSPTEVLEELRHELDTLGSDQPTRRDQLQQRISAMESALREANEESRQYLVHNALMRPARAIYVSSEENPMSVPLMIQVGVDPGYFDDYHNTHLKLWDFTLQGTVRTYTGVAQHPQEAILRLFREFADDAPYPTGNMRFEINAMTLYLSGLRRETVTYPTDGGTRWAALLRGLSIGAMAIGAGAALLGQAEVAVPAFVISGLLAGAGGVFSLYDRLEHGDFEWDLQTGLDILDIAGAMLTLGASSGVTATARGVGRMTIREGVQLTVGRAQIAIMVGVHVGRINAAIQTRDPDRVAEALLRALADGALILIVHRASARLQTLPAERATEPSTGGAGTARTMAGTPPETRPGAPETPPTQPTAEPGTPEFHRQAHDAWVAEMTRTGMEPRPPATPATTEPLRPGQFAGENIQTPREAYRLYEESLERAPGMEVGIFRNTSTGRYTVRVGDAMSVRSPEVGNWETVMHYHPNRANVLTYRMPAPADVQGTAIDAFRGGRAITEFVEYDIPGAGRSRAAYTVTSEGQVTVEYARPDGTRMRRSFANLNDYQRAYGERTTHLDPQSDEYRWVMQDLNDFYASRSELGAGRTMGGTTRPPGRSSAQVEREAREESMRHWETPGQTTATRFARHEQTFDSMAATLRNTHAELASRGQGALLPTVNESVLRMPVDHFIETHPTLGPQWREMQRIARGNPELRREMTQFLEGRLEGAGSRMVGSRRPDLVEFFLERGNVIVTDVTTATTRVHQFKTEFYRAVMERMISGRTGPRVYAVDINLAVNPPTSRVTP